MTAAEISRSLARHIIQRMGETGQPPERGALTANVGTEPLLRVLEEEYLEPMRELGRNSSFKLVQAPFGGGKTHFLHCLRETAWQHGFATSMVGVSPDECAFDDSVAIYRAAVRNLELPPDGPEVEPRPGIEQVLRFVVEDRVEKHGEAPVRAWIRDELRGARVDSSAIRRAAQNYMLAVIERDDATEELMAAFLKGEQVTAAELSPHGIREQLDKKEAYRFLRSIAQLLRAIDVPGVVLLFDEMDRVMSLSVKRRRAIGDSLRQMIDHCGQATLPSVLWVYAIPPEFMTTVVPEYPALEQRLGKSSSFSPTTPLSPVIDLDHLAVGAVELFHGIGTRLLELYERAHDHRFDRSTQETNLALLARETGERQLESGARRNFVKAWIQLLTQQHRDTERALTESDIRAVSQGNRGPEPADMPDEEEFY